MKSKKHQLQILLLKAINPNLLLWGWCFLESTISSRWSIMQISLLKRILGFLLIFLSSIDVWFCRVRFCAFVRCICTQCAGLEKEVSSSRLLSVRLRILYYLKRSSINKDMENAVQFFQRKLV